MDRVMLPHAISTISRRTPSVITKQQELKHIATQTDIYVGY